MIHRYSNATQTRWDHGDFKVRLMPAGGERPIGFCEGTDEDMVELNAIAEAEGAEHLTIHKKMLKTGREVWTLGDPPEPFVDDFG
ncbi:MAG: hypothetical protein ACI9MR_000363 [Myxococcota bacterium]|jgi:hypothetical protein